MNRVVSSLRCYCTPSSQHEIRGRFQNFRKPIYRAPYLNPLENGPDFTFQDGRTVSVTSQVQLDYKLDQLRLGKKIISLLGNIKKIEDVHRNAEAQRISAIKSIEMLRPTPKGKDTIQ